jgi:hypothetical protein
MEIVIINNPNDGVSFAPEVSFTSKTAVTPTLIVASYDSNGKLLEIDMATVPAAANTEITLAASIPVRSDAASYKVFVWDSITFVPLSYAQIYS